MSAQDEQSGAADAGPNLKSALALSEASRRIERTEDWERYTEALGRADRAEQQLESMQATMRATREDRRIVHELKLEYREKLEELERITAARLAAAPDELIAQRLETERLAWAARKRGWLRHINDMIAHRDWDRVRRGNDSY